MVQASRKTTGEIIRTRRIGLGLDQRQAAEIAGMSQGHWSNIEICAHPLTEKYLEGIFKALQADQGLKDEIYDSTSYEQEHGLVRTTAKRKKQTARNGQRKVQDDSLAELVALFEGISLEELTDNALTHLIGEKLSDKDYRANFADFCQRLLAYKIDTTVPMLDR